MIEFTRKIRRNGGSLTFTIPDALAIKDKLRKGKLVWVKVYKSRPRVKRLIYKGV